MSRIRNKPYTRNRIESNHSKQGTSRKRDLDIYALRTKL